jgi:uncharacterized phage protein (TIGR01671 family)
MNNRIRKFRVWDKLAQRMIYPDKGYQGHYVLDLNGRFHNLQNGSGGDDHVVIEYTGLNDSKGNEIYEGDVVKTIYDDDFSVGAVFYHEETGSYRIQSKNQLLPIVTYRFVENKPQGLLLVVHEVIGNIFENNELLTQHEQNK